jgi:iron complex outermembrane receptor protein
MASLNVFWMEFQDELIKSGAVDIFGEPVMGNADRSRHIGIELQGQTDLFPGFTLSGNATISSNRLISYSIVDMVKNDTVYRTNLDGNPIAGSPDYMGNLRFSYSYNSINAALDVKYVGAFYTDNTRNDFLKNDAYTVVNATIAYRIPWGSGVFLTLRGEVRNLFNALYTMSGEGSEFFPAAERNYIVALSLQL